MAADLWIWHIHECKILSFPPRLWEIQRVSAIGLEKETLIVTAGQCWCPHRVSLITRPFRESAKGKGIIAETQQRGGQGHVPNGHKELIGSFSPHCLQRMGWVWSERNSFQGLVSLLLHAIYLPLPDTPHQAFVNVLEKTLALITDGSYPKDTIRSKLAPSLGFPSEYRASQTSAARVSC